MKKKLLLFVFILLISIFEIRPRYTHASAAMQSNRSQVQTWTQQYNGMTYRIFTYDISMEVVNITKERLEVEKLKIEIEKLKLEMKNLR